MNRVTDQQRRQNEESRDRWQLYANHRRQVTGHLLACCRSSEDRLCVLGAGNCNDLDLKQLGEAYNEVHLVDLDLGALRTGVAEQATDSANICLHGDVDVTGIASMLGQWSPGEAVPDAPLSLCLAQALASPAPEIPAPFDVVVSACLLTQLIQSVMDTLGPDHPKFLELILKVRIRHLRLLLELTAPGGSCLIITDVVSSTTCAALPNVPEVQLAQTIDQLIQQRNFFTGTNPYVLRSLFESDPELAPQVREVELLHPWLWNFGPRVYAVCAIKVRRLG